MGIARKLLVFAHTNHAGIRANTFTFASAASASDNVANLKLGKQIHEDMIKTGFNCEVEAGNVLF